MRRRNSARVEGYPRPGKARDSGRAGEIDYLQWLDF